MVWRTWIFLLGGSCFSAAAFAEAPLQGLLTLPEVFGELPCEVFEPKEIALLSSPASAAHIGRIRVAQPWTQLGEGGCAGLRVDVVFDTGVVAELPQRELNYESPAVIVLEAHSPWFRVQLPAGSAWLMASARDQYFPLVALLRDGLSYVAEPELIAWDHPGGSALPPSWPVGTPVRVRESQVVDDALWLRIEILSHSVCDAAERPKVLAQAWVPAHAAYGKPNLWFYSRGC